MVLVAVILVAATVLAYKPVWHAGFIWDDDDYVTKNKLLTAPDGLRRIWFSLDSPSQYFPLTYTVLRLEHACWGLDPSGYHGVNIVLHAINALLVWWLLRRLAVPGAWFGAAVWALHPVQVETVAWVTELKNVLMCFFLLLALLAWVRFIERESKWKWFSYSLALFLFALALTAKTTACTLPAALLLIPWMRGQRIDRQRILAVVPFVALGLGMGLLTVWWERFHVGTHGPAFSMSVMDRVLVASRALWFYAGKLFWPVNLTFSYPRWEISAFHPLAYFWPLATAVLGVTMFCARDILRRDVPAAVLFFAATLSPTLGFIMLYTFLYSFVADHYQYVACLGLIALACASATLALDRVRTRSCMLKALFYAAIMLVLGTLTWRQCGMYADIETLWRVTIARNPASWMAHFNLASALVQQRQLAEAVNQYQQTLQLKPDYAPAYYGLGIALSQGGNLDQAMICYREALRINPGYADAHNNLGNALFQTGKVDDAIAHYQEALRLNPKNEEARNNLAIAMIQKGGWEEAIDEFNMALQIDPQNAETENNLAWALVTTPAKATRNGNEALRLSQDANRLTENRNPSYLRTLAAALAECGQFAQATETAERALRLAQAQGNPGLAAALRSDTIRYQAGQAPAPH